MSLIEQTIYMRSIARIESKKKKEQENRTNYIKTLDHQNISNLSKIVTVI